MTTKLRKFRIVFMKTNNGISCIFIIKNKSDLCVIQYHVTKNNGIYGFQNGRLGA